MNLNKYLQVNFPSLEIKKPLFYNYDYGLRYEVGIPSLSIYKDNNQEVLNKEYFEKALYRAKKLFETIFEPDDNICIVFQKYSEGRQRIQKNSYIFKSINHFDKIEYLKVKKLYREEQHSKNEHYRRIAIHTKLNNIDYSTIINKAIYTDFEGSNIESFFINIDKDVIYNIYDDRGLDIIAKDKKILKKLYTEFNDWILDYDREKIDNLF